MVLLSHRMRRIAAIMFVAGLGYAQSFRFAIVGDRTGEAQPGVYEQVWREVDRYHPSFAVNVGDTIQGGDDATAAQEWESVRKVWTTYSYKLFFTPGNHDIWSAASEKIYEKFTGHPPMYSFDWQQAHFTILDNSRTENLSEPQMKFLAEDLERNRDRNPKFVFFHRPTVWLIPLKFQSDFPLHDLVRRYHVAAVVSGHTHQYTRIEKEGVVYLSVGSSGGHLRGTGFKEGWFFQWAQAEVRGGKVDLRVKELGPPLGEGRVVE